MMPTYESMMHSLHCRNWKEAVCTLRSVAEQDPAAHHLVLYTVAIRACSVSGQLDEATALYDQMVDVHAIRPDEVTLIAMLKGCSVLRDWNLAQLWSTKIVEDGGPDPQRALSVAAYSLMISCGDEMTWAAAWSLFQEIRKMDHLELDMIAINSMLDTLARAKQGALCQELFMEIRGDPQWSRSLNARSFEAVVRSCVSAGDLSAALNYVKLMQSEEFGFAATKQMVSDLLRTIKCYDGEVDAFGLAVSMWNQVVGAKPKPIYPDAVLFGIMIDLCSKHKDFGFALKLFREMVTEYNVQPTVIVFNNLLKCAAAASRDGIETVDGPKPLSFYLEMIGDLKSVYGVEPDQFTFNIVLNAVIQSTRCRLLDSMDLNAKYLVITELLTFWSTEMAMKNEVSYSTMIHALSSMKREHFGEEKDILYLQLLALYGSGCDEGYLGHWSRNRLSRPETANHNEWNLEMHGWSVHMACVAMQYFCDKELPSMAMEKGGVVKDVIVSVGRGNNSEDGIAKIRETLLHLLRDSMGLQNVRVLEGNDGCLFTPRSDLLRHFETTRLSFKLEESPCIQWIPTKETKFKME